MPSRLLPLLSLAVLLAAAMPAALLAVGPGDYSGCAGTVAGRVLAGNPANYLSQVAILQPGDLLQLAAGTYASGLTLANKNGTPGNCIVIEGPATGPSARFTGRDCCNTVSLSDSSYLVIRNLELDGLDRLGDGVKAEGTAAWVHHLTLENLWIHGHGADQSIVGINSKCPAWNWVVRRNVIEEAGTGLYLGNSNGEDELSHSLIEHNLVRDTVGYNMQIKHQNGRATALGAPATGTTIVRHNVFSKAANGSTGDDARPNLLVGHWPLAGAGANDQYSIYGNFFWQNPDEALFQGEGHVALYANLFVNDAGTAINVQPHNDVPKRIEIFHNTVVASAAGIRVTGGDAAFLQRVRANASFATTPLSGGAQSANVTGAYAAAAGFLANPDGEVEGAVDRLDLFPLPGALVGAAIDPVGLTTFADWNRDWNGTPFDLAFRGAYSGSEVSNPGWLPALERKPDVPELPLTSIFADGFEAGDLSAWSSSTP